MRVPWNWCDRCDKPRHEKGERYALQCRVQQKILRPCRLDVREWSIFPVLEHQNYNLALQCHEAHWKSSNASLYHQILWNIYMRTSQNHVCTKISGWCSYKVCTKAVLYVYVKYNYSKKKVTYITWLLSSPPYESSSICGRSQWYKVA